MPEFTTEKHPQGVTLGVSGEIDLACSGELREAVLAALEAANHVQVHLANVTYIDSSGIAALVEGLQEAKARQKQFVLRDVSDAVLSVLKLARLDQVFTIENG